MQCVNSLEKIIKFFILLIANRFHFHELVWYLYDQKTNSNYCNKNNNKNKKRFRCQCKIFKFAIHSVLLKDWKYSQLNFYWIYVIYFTSQKIQRRCTHFVWMKSKIAKCIITIKKKNKNFMCSKIFCFVHYIKT